MGGVGHRAQFGATGSQRQGNNLLTIVTPSQDEEDDDAELGEDYDEEDA